MAYSERRTQLDTIDQLLTFAAGELIADDGALAPFPDIIERYRHWSQGCAIDLEAFDALFSEFGEFPVIELWGVKYLAGARLRQHLKVVGA